MRRIGLLSLLSLVATLSVTAASLPTSRPEDVGLSSERLQRIHLLVQRHIDSGDITVGIQRGVVVWTDVSSLTGSVSSSHAGLR